MLPLCPRPRHAGQDPLSNALALELGDRPEDVHLELASRCRRVDPFGEADERDPQRLQLLEQGDEVLQAAPKAVEPPADGVVA